MIVAYYSSDTGEVSSVLTGPDLAGFPEPVAGLQALMLTNFVELPGYITGATYVPLPVSPSPVHTFNWTTKQWEDPRTLQDLKDSKWAEVKAQRDAAEFGTFVWSGHTFDGDEAAQRRINLAVMAAQVALASSQAWAIDWTLADNSVVNLSAADMVAVAEALGTSIASAHTWARSKRAQIEAATSREELDAL